MEPLEVCGNIWADNLKLAQLVQIVQHFIFYIKKEDGYKTE